MNSVAAFLHSARVCRHREITVLLGYWLLLAVFIVLMALGHTKVPGLYYDEAVFGGMAKDLLRGETRATHMAGNETIVMFGRPFPLFVQFYLGAIKCYLLLPSIALFGTSAAVLRFTALAWSLLALLVFLLFVRKWLGLSAALLAGGLLAFDPTYFFLSVFDWGVAVPSLLFRFTSFLCLLSWWRQERLSFAFLAALFAGLGFLNKIDFAVLAAGAGAAFACCYARPLVTRLRDRPIVVPVMLLGAALGAGPMLRNLFRVARNAPGSPEGELTEKFNAAWSMYDGSYFHRMFSTGGMFEPMYVTSSPVWSPWGLVVLVSMGVLLCVAALPSTTREVRRRAAFLLLAFGLVTLGVFVLPGAARIHHAVLAFPFPHLIVAYAFWLVWNGLAEPSAARRAVQVLLAIGLVAVLGFQLKATRATQQFVAETGGRGRWSDTFDAFCAEIKDQQDLMIISLDWGFNEQLAFVTDGPELYEPFWEFDEKNPEKMPVTSDCIYLAHPLKYSLYAEGEAIMNSASQSGMKVEIRPYRDRQQQIAFYTIRFLQPPKAAPDGK